MLETKLLLIIVLALIVSLTIKLFSIISDTKIGFFESFPVALVMGLVFVNFPFLLGVFAVAVTVALITIRSWKSYERRYFQGEEFRALKASVEVYVQECNELNDHIRKLELTSLPGSTSRTNSQVDYRDSGDWNYKREKFKLHTNAANVCNCSQSVCDGARRNPMKYICKYFGIEEDEASLAAFEALVNNFSAAIEGKEVLEAKRRLLLEGLEIPRLIRKYDMDLVEEELGLEAIELNRISYPCYKFLYVSSGGYASTECVVEMNMGNLVSMISYLNGRIGWKKSAAGQRALMTPALRQRILSRDGYTCKRCGISMAEEPHLLLEVDHIVPVSKGGLTCEDNLQTLCWKCNRSKGAKVDAGDSCR